MYYLRTLALSFLSCCLLVGFAAAQKKPVPNPSPAATVQAKRFELKEGNFSIGIFEAPFQTQNIGAGKETIKQFLWKFEKTLYTVAYSEFNKNELIQAFNDMNSGMRKAILGAGIQLVSEKEISFGKYPGREFIYITPNGVKYVGRNYLVKTMGYQIVAGYVDEESEKEALKVLNSFQLLNEKN